MVMKGKAAYTPTPGLGDRWHVIGDGKNPIYICKKSEVSKLFDKFFWHVYEMWRYFHAKINLPGIEWHEIDPDILAALMTLDNYYENEFSLMSVSIKYQEAILKSFHALGKMLAKVKR